MLRQLLARRAGDGALFGIVHAHIYTRYFPRGWGTQGKMFFPTPQPLSVPKPW